MSRLTLLEVHLDGNINVLPRVGQEGETSDEVVTDDDSSGGRGKLVAGMLLFGLVAVAAIAAKRKLGGDEPTYEPPAERPEVTTT